MIVSSTQNRLWQVVFGLVAFGLLLYFSLSLGQRALSRHTERASPTRDTIPNGLPELAADAVSGELNLKASQGGKAIPHPAGKNCADFYKNAFVLFKALTEGDKKILRSPREKIEQDKAAALFARIQPIMDILRRAKAEGTYSDWGTGPIHFDTPIPQINIVQDLARLARWDATYRFPNDPAGGLDDADIQLRLGDSIRAQGLIGTLVAASTDRMTVALIHDNLQSLTPDLMDQAAGLLPSGGTGEEMASAMAQESDAAKAMIDALLDPESRAKMLRGIPAVSDLKAREIEAQLPTIREQGEWIAAIDKQFAAEAMLPDAQFKAWWNEIQAEAVSRPFAAELISSLSSVRGAIFSVAVDRAMLNEGMQILRNGGGAAETVADPTNGRPFTYLPTLTGFELRSPFTYKNKAATMTFSASKP